MDGRQSPPPESMLESILARALDPAAIRALMEQFAIDKTVGAPDLASRAQHSRVRIQMIEGIRYILCPVPPFYDGARNVETGFAIDVDQDHFDVYPYMCNQESGETIILSRLPHCVVHAIKVDAGSYQEIDDRLKEVANESSAILFISNLYTELGVGMDSPVEFFDNRLFQQLIGKVLSVKEGKWVNHRIVGMRFDELLAQHDHLDEGSISFVDSKKRVIAHLAHFLFETVRVMRIEDLLDEVDADSLFSLLGPVIAHLVEGNDLAIAMEIIKNVCPPAPRAVLASIFAELVANGYQGHAMALERVSGLSFANDAAIAKNTFAIALRDGAIDRIEGIEGFLGVPFSADSGELHQAVNALVRRGRVASAIELERLARESCKPDDDVVLGAFADLLSRGAVVDVITLEGWTGVPFHIDENQVAGVAIALLERGDVAGVEQLIRWARVTWQPEPSTVQDILATLVKRGQVDVAITVEAWSKATYVASPDDVQVAYKALLFDAKAFVLNVGSARRLSEWTRIPPTGDFVHELYASILHAAIDDDRKIDAAKALQEWTGIKPCETLILAEYKTALKPGQFKGLNVALVRRLQDWTGIPVPQALAMEAFSSLLRPPLRSYSIDDAALLSTFTGSKPGNNLIQATYRCILERQVVDMKADPVAASKRLQAWAGIPPTESVTRAGQNLALLRGDIASAKAIGEWACVQPQESLVQDAIALLLQHPDPSGTWHDRIEEIVSWTHIKPVDGMVQSAYAAILLGRWLTPDSIEAAASLANLTRVKPAADIIGKAREKLAKEEQLGYTRAEVSGALEGWIRHLDAMEIA